MQVNEIIEEISTYATPYIVLRKKATAARETRPSNPSAS